MMTGGLLLSLVAATAPTPAYVCDVRDGAGAHVANLSLSVRSVAEMPHHELFDATQTPIWLDGKSDAAAVPDISMPTSWTALRGGAFIVSVTTGEPSGNPPIADQTKVRLVLDGDPPAGGGFVVVYRQRPGTHFEIPSTGPHALGLCRMMRDGASQ